MTLLFSVITRNEAISWNHILIVKYLSPPTPYLFNIIPLLSDRPSVRSLVHWNRARQTTDYQIKKSLRLTLECNSLSSIVILKCCISLNGIASQARSERNSFEAMTLLFSVITRNEAISWNHILIVKYLSPPTPYLFNIIPLPLCP
ncbi:hypothetical protein Pedsa_2196 [Pseudopedobacter saltans DSM 12145]|uniref:Uncharacterized protein n=1 Tax=Pseudopedobacter saltans (strain ATCC 51119 / DSM 12145 / JCM 21818 / CCUG 39354 / LMG 10337 / NBRC 100064 / NCIMB 13643) TaxID=762903 RepID=F0SBQ7_PSESL|nr:hypothetical protein Pedsa_2196 [Pseudopedobacter saltans DSM 12145]